VDFFESSSFMPQKSKTQKSAGSTNNTISEQLLRKGLVSQQKNENVNQ